MVGLSRSDAGAAALTRAGAEALRGDVNDLDHLRAAAASADDVIHAAFNHDMSNLKQTSEDDRRVIETLGEAVAGSDRPLVVTSGTALARSKPGAMAVETDEPYTSAKFPPEGSAEGARISLERRGGEAVPKPGTSMWPRESAKRSESLKTEIYACEIELMVRRIDAYDRFSVRC